ncbi:RHS repeat domain-containing protein [Kitasatospora sp. NPDC088134]|uniref:RHS repeat domain-containing protein n=1 Tax=Kitasatospora sp. NPDC088134 TaxID=3364071 RepID=UPI0037F5CC3B
MGTPIQLLAADGSAAWQARSSLWGLTTYPKGSTTYTPLRFPGQYYDSESRLHYNLHRYYDPETARFASPDPLGLDADPNHHAYVSNPVVWADPLGLMAKKPKRPKGDFGDPLDFGHGFTGRLDKFDHGHAQDFEIHVYRNRQEFGIFGSNGWFYKHGTGGGDIPQSVENRLKGRAVTFMRDTGRLGKKGTENIKGDRWKRPRLGNKDCEK